MRHHCKVFGLAVAAVASAYLSGPPAQAGYIVTLEQVGGNVVATGSGTIDLTGLSFLESITSGIAAVNPSNGVVATGPTAGQAVDIYTGFTGPTSFGSGTLTAASSGSGDRVAIHGNIDELRLPAGYLSGDPLADTSTYDSATFASLGVTPGTYVWTWGGDDTFTLKTVPEPGSLALLAPGAARPRFHASPQTRVAER